jgi:hypothetical protein
MEPYPVPAGIVGGFITMTIDKKMDYLMHMHVTKEF